MGAKKIRPQDMEPPKDWLTAGRLLSIPEVCAIARRSPWFLYELIGQGLLVPAMGRKPYKFDPLHVHAVFFTAQATPKRETAPADSRRRSPSSLITRGRSESVSRKSYTKEDLWA